MAMVTAMPDTGGPMCIIGKCVTTRMGISKHNLATTTERLVGANGAQIELDSAVFLNITVEDAKSSQLVYVTIWVTRLFLSQKARKELRVVHPDFLAQMSRTGKNQRTAMDDDDNNRDRPNDVEKHNHPEKYKLTYTKDNKNTDAYHSTEPTMIERYRRHVSTC